MKASASTSTKSRRPKGRAPGTFAPQTNAPASALILFDIDGTLVLTGGAGGRAMSLAFEELFAIPSAFQGIPMAGRTDTWILADAALVHGIPAHDPRLARFPETYLRHLANELDQPSALRRMRSWRIDKAPSRASAAGLSMLHASECSSMKRPHRVCDECGYYGGEQRIAAREG